ncbi:aminoglycoside 6-adenylyltransferase [Kribbella solani]|uniref:nucleotidyltransferase domain-containing protein n=1 Tax=Kribbella solani TaxID=236067 RepID=UPI0029B8E7CA|nr:nucleotidyltransferase domain-containing protein [Kribbella solani]MDX3002617.1 aminoglycoside 6-adenylyltransferase [Kribbella solani]
MNMVGVQVPEHLRGLADSVLAEAERDPRIVAVIAGGSVATGTGDEYSDLDLVLVCTPEGQAGCLAEAKEFAGRVGKLLAGFTGEHVGEPRLLIALYGPPLAHVDLKFVTMDELHDRVEDGVVLWQRDDGVDRVFKESAARWPQVDPQWIEDRIWVWVHYVAVKIRRGELFEAIDALGMIRSAAIAPLAGYGRTFRPAGVRRLETLVPELVPELRATVATADQADCLRALNASVDVYRTIRDRAGAPIIRRTAAENATVAYLQAATPQP